MVVIETELASRKEQSKLENNNSMLNTTIVICLLTDLPVKEPDSDYLTDESSDTESDTPSK